MRLLTICIREFARAAARNYQRILVELTLCVFTLFIRIPFASNPIELTYSTEYGFSKLWKHKES